MIRALVIADSGAAMAAITGSLSALPHVHIAAYASGRSSVGALATATAPHVVLVDEMDEPSAAVRRIEEICSAAPATSVVGLSRHPNSAWVADARRAGAWAVVSCDLEATALDVVLREAAAAHLTRSLYEPPRRAAA
jgi:two-component system response regulator NreC